MLAMLVGMLAASGARGDIRISVARAQKADIAWDGSKFGAAYTWDYALHDLLFRSFDTLVMNPGPELTIASPGVYKRIDLIQARGLWTAAWECSGATSYVVCLSTFDDSGVPRAPTLQVSSSLSYRPSVVWNGSAYYVTWQGYSALGEGQVGLAAVDATGGFLVPESVLVPPQSGVGVSPGTRRRR